MLIIVIVGFQNFVYRLAWAVDLGVQITDMGRSLYIGSFCPAMISLSRYLEEEYFDLFKCVHFSMVVFKVYTTNVQP